jgi:hypothetical protein
MRNQGFNKFLYRLVLTLICLFTLKNSFAANYTWNGAVSIVWNNSANWTPDPGFPAGFPIAGDNVTINTSGSATIFPTLASNLSINTLTISSKTLTINSTVVLNVSYFNMSGGTIIGSSGAGALNITANANITGGTISSPSSMPLNIGTNSVPIPVIFGSTLTGPTINTGSSIYASTLQMTYSTFGSNAYSQTFKLINTVPITNIGNNVFNGATTIEAAGTADIKLSNTGPHTYGYNIIFKNSGSGDLYTAYANADIYTSSSVVGTTFERTSTCTGEIFANWTGTNIITRNVAFKSVTVGSTKGIRFGGNGGITILDLTRSISTGTNGAFFTDGILELRNFQQPSPISGCTTNCPTAQTITLSGTAKLVFESGSIFYGNVTASSPRMIINGTTFAGVSNGFTKNGSGDDISLGGFSFPNTTVGAGAYFNNSGSGALYLGGGTFSTQVQYNNMGTGGIYPANTGTTYYNNNISLSCSSWNAAANTNTGNGVIFGKNGGFSELASGMFITVNGQAGFSPGVLELTGFKQFGNTPQNLSLGLGMGGVAPATSLLRFGANTIFNGIVITSSPRLELNGSTFNNNSSFVKNYADPDPLKTTDVSLGGNTFGLLNGTSVQHTFSINCTAGSIRLAGTNPDIYNSHTTFQTGVSPAYNGDNIFKGDITTSAGNIFGGGLGVVLMDAEPIQIISGTNAEPIYNRVKINKSSGITISRTITIGVDLNFASGSNCIINNSSSLVTFNAGSAISGTVGKNSTTNFFTGQVKKRGDTDFEFPTGKNGIYHSIKITGINLGATTAEFTAEYFNSSMIGTVLSPLMDDSDCEYWNILSNSISPAKVNLLWNNETCTPINKNVMAVSRYNSSTGNSEIQGTVTSGDNYIGSVQSTSLTTFGNFTLGYTNVIYIDGSKVNQANCLITGADNFHYLIRPPFISGPIGTNGGILKVHPEKVSTNVDVNIQEGNNLPMTIRLNINTSGVIVNGGVQSNVEGSFISLSTDYYTLPIPYNYITFYKQKPQTIASNIKTNLSDVSSDGLTFDRSTKTSFQIILPVNFTGVQTLRIYDNNNILTTINSLSPLTWTPSVPGPTSPTLYKFELEIGPSGSTKIYTGQFLYQE